ncbi:vWA domain-containing protein [Marinomonas primoryensis]|jgi:Ca-activated chloride channel family protein|uniref:von Willebrand factor type A domain-containing protein n=1 Tax=Marinomonas primoryensis TaxID=178399 RepID=A0A859CWV8_9GAMM|nr:VWA domain-containing protein [Marinomonas primoryensis]QKK81068.1 von Willebrand factor type A domain-containing protein [Marinomonas primoryensis]
MMFFDVVHFERPYWLLFIPLTLLVAFFFRLNNSKKNTLHKVVDPNLLNHLVYKNASNNLNMWLGLIALTLCWIGLAGVSWTKNPTTMFENTQKTVLIVDQSLSMYATDIKPNRQTQLKQTVRDILEQSKEGEIALVAFAGEGFIISPFSQDRETITHFLLALDPIIMPVYGGNLSSGVATALSLNKDDSAPLHLIIFTDDLSQLDKEKVPTLLKGLNIQLDIVAVGTPQGGPIKLPDGQVLKKNGMNVIPTVPISDLKALTTNLGGTFHQGRLTSRELAQITSTSLNNEQTQKAQNKSIHWTEQGQWFALPFLFWLAFQFRKGMVLMLFIGLFSLPAEKLQASPLDWFLTQDQKGQHAVDQGNWQKADRLFQQPNWKAASSYALKNYPAAIQALDKLDKNAAENYNLGNALALSGDTKKAMQAYETALEQDPSLKAAKENLEYLKQQEQEQEQKKKEQQEKDEQASTKQNEEKDQNKQPSQSDSNDKNDSKDPSDSKKDNKKNEKQDNNKTPEDNEQNKNSDSKNKNEQAKTTLDKEKEQALNQWLKQIQDDPGKLLQRKLWYLHQEKRNENRFTQEDGQNPW